ncbi:MAG: hypothetical protein DWQ36_16040 [Acidobacteria bacterium]|nr:MAG: hypothetical protein DWQ30_20445 [Acidobacteriota bacterium]REK05621.1 MAG: hypothetical protein DWQ36_16040 [Acidobacteriota bacterium]
MIRRSRAAAVFVVGLIWTSRQALGCAVCFADDGSGAPLRWAIGLLLVLVVLLQMALARFFWRVLRAAPPAADAPPAQDGGRRC